MLGDPGRGSKVYEALDRKIGEPGENPSQIVAHWEFQPAAAFHHRKNRRNLRSRLRAADMQPILVAERTAISIKQLEMNLMDSRGTFQANKPIRLPRVLSLPRNHVKHNLISKLL